MPCITRNVMDTLIASARADPLYFLIRCTEQQSHLSAPFRFSSMRESLFHLSSSPEPFPKLNSTLSRFPCLVTSFFPLSSLPSSSDLPYHVNKKIVSLLHSRNLWSNYLVTRLSLCRELILIRTYIRVSFFASGNFIYFRVPRSPR